MVLADSEVERVLAVVAHPDDVDFGAAGTIATWTKAGLEVVYLLCTAGDAGGFDPDVPRSQIPSIRQAEQAAAAAEVGVSDVRFLGYPDGRLTPSIELRRDISRVIRQVRPQRVVCQSPVRNFERIGASHPDHLAAGESCLCAVYPDARTPFAHPELLAEGLAEWKVSEVWLMGGPDPTHFIDVTDTFERKIAALRAHVSQTAHEGDLESRLRSWLSRAARSAGLPEGRLAESFRVVDTS
jgi:LmbE family N-acetylglucosaminyl deacetylase